MRFRNAFSASLGSPRGEPVPFSKNTEFDARPERWPSWLRSVVGRLIERPRYAIYDVLALVLMPHTLSASPPPAARHIRRFYFYRPNLPLMHRDGWGRRHDTNIDEAAARAIFEKLHAFPDTLEIEAEIRRLAELRPMIRRTLPQRRAAETFDPAVLEPNRSRSPSVSIPIMPAKSFSLDGGKTGPGVPRVQPATPEWC